MTLLRVAQRASPTDALDAAIPDEGRWQLVREIAREVRADDLNGLAAELSYRLFVALVPLLTFLASLGAIAADELGGENPARSVVDAAGDTISGSAASSIESEVSSVISSSGPGTLALGLVGALWTGGLAMGTVVKALDRIQHTDQRRPRVRRWVVTGVLTVLAGLLFVAATVGIVLSGLFADSIPDWLGVGEVPGAVVTAVGWLAAFLLVIAAASLLYWAAPSNRARFRPISLGGLGFGIIWVVGSVGFAIYVANFSSYASTYGVLGAVLIALGWLYFSSMAFFIGAELDLVLHRKREHG